MENCVPTLSGEKMQSKKKIINPFSDVFAKYLFVVVELVNSDQNQDFNDATSLVEINSPMLLIDHASTPKKKQACSQEVPTLVTSCNTH